MPRYLVERSFAEGCTSPWTPPGPRLAPKLSDQPRLRCHLGPLLRDARKDQDLLHLRRAQPRSRPPERHGEQPPVDRITEGRVLDPYFYS